MCIMYLHPCIHTSQVTYKKAPPVASKRAFIWAAIMPKRVGKPKSTPSTCTCICMYCQCVALCTPHVYVRRGEAREDAVNLNKNFICYWCLSVYTYAHRMCGDSPRLCTMMCVCEQVFLCITVDSVLKKALQCKNTGHWVLAKLCGSRNASQWKVNRTSTWRWSFC